MKRISKLLVACLLHGAAFAATFEQKTFLLPHNPISTQLLEHALFRTHRHTAGLDQDGHVQATAFYGESVNRAALGRYFGIGNGKNSFKVGAELTAPIGAGGVADNTTELDGGFLIHDRANAQNSTLGGKVTLLPKQTVYGVNLTYRQSFAGPFAGVFFQASAPLVQVKNDLGLKIENETKVTLGTNQFGLSDFFAGRVSADGANAQTGLTKGKMVGGPRYTTGLADINLQLGYKLVCNEDRHVDVYLRGIVPTGNKSTGEYLFEPLVGNNGHFGMGAGVDADMTLWNDYNRGRVSLQGGAGYNYIFESTETRMAGIYRRSEDIFKFNHYALVGKPGATTVAPAANALTQDFRVRPGSQLELNTGLSFHSAGGVSVNVGYNLNWREAERVYRKADNNFFDSNVVVAKAATLNARVPVEAAPPGPLVGLMTVSRAQTLHQQAIADQAVAGAAGTDIATAHVAAIAGGVVANGQGVGTDAGAALVRAIGAAPLNDSQLAAYKAGAQLYAATGYDVLFAADVTGARAAAVAAAIAAAGVTGAPAPGAAGSSAVATAARNLVQNLQNANVSYHNSIRQEALITHVLGAALGYSFEIQKGFPLMVGAGGQYELPHSTNAGLESYKLFIKAGLSF